MVKKGEGLTNNSQATTYTTADISQLRKQILNNQWFQCMEENVSNKYKPIKRSRRDHMRLKASSLFRSNGLQQSIYPNNFNITNSDSNNLLFQQLSLTDLSAKWNNPDKSKNSLPYLNNNQTNFQKLMQMQQQQEFMNRAAPNAFGSQQHNQHQQSQSQLQNDDVEDQENDDILDKKEFKNFSYTYSYTQQERKKEIIVKKYDLQKLKPNQYLNDTIVNFFLKFYEIEILPKDIQEKVLIFNTYFMSKLAPNEQVEQLNSSDVEVMGPVFEKNYQTVQRWIKEDIFEKDFLVFPLNLPEHWSVVIVCNHKVLLEKKKQKDSSNITQPQQQQKAKDSEKMEEEKQEIQECKEQDIDAKAKLESEDKEIEMNKLPNEVNTNPCILYFDSFGLLDKKYSNMIRLYLQKEYDEKKKQEVGIDITFDEHTLPSIQPLIPRQTNYVDCGLYLLEYVENFLNSSAIEKSAFTSNDSKYWIQLRWFPRINIKQKRKHIKQLVLDLPTMPIQEAVSSYQSKRSELLAEYKDNEEEYDEIDFEDFDDHMYSLDISSNPQQEKHRLLLDYYMNPNYNKYEVL